MKYFLAIACCVLIALNLYFIFGKGKPPHNGTYRDKEKFKNEIRHRIVDALHFDNEQKKLLDTELEKHVTNIESIRFQEKKMLERINLLHIDTNNFAQRDSLIQLYGQNKIQFEREMFRHFEQLKAMTKPSQTKEYNAFIQQLIQHLKEPKHH